LVEGNDAFAAIFKDTVLKPFDFATSLDGLGGEAPKEEEDSGFDGHSEEEGDAGAVVGGVGEAAFGGALVSECFAEVREGGGRERGFLFVAAPCKKEVVASGVSGGTFEGGEGGVDGFSAFVTEGGEGRHLF
jgi:hypothetical protein